MAMRLPRARKSGSWPGRACKSATPAWARDPPYCLAALSRADALSTARQLHDVMARPGGRHREEGDNGWPICRAPQRGGMAGPQEKAPVVGKWLAHSRAPHGWWCGLFKPDFELEDTSTRELKFEKRNFQFVDPRVLCKNSNSGLKSPHHQQWRSCPP